VDGGNCDITARDAVTMTTEEAAAAAAAATVVDVTKNTVK